MSIRRFVPIIAVITVGLTCAVYADNWPHWRGPYATGVSQEKGLPTTWGDTDNVARKARLRGLGISSPIVWGDRVFVTSQVGAGVSRDGPTLVQNGDPAAAGERPLGGSDAAAGNRAAAGPVSFLVTAFDRVAGGLLWEYVLPSQGPLIDVHEKHNLATASAVTDGERVYAWFGTGQIAALDLNGKPLWTRNLGGDYSPFDIDWGHGSSPIVFRDTVILLCYHSGASYLLALDARTGAVRWKVDHVGGALSYSTPFVVESSNPPEVIVNSSVGLSGHNALTGARLWHIEEPNRFPIPMPLQHDGVIYTSRGYRSGPFMAIRPGGKGDISKSHVLWRTATGAPYVSSLVYYDGLLYMAGDVGVITAIDAKTGERVWQERVGGVFSASPVAADGKIYMVSEDGQTIVLAAGRPPRILARNRLNARQMASPAISAGRLFIRSDDYLYAIGK